MAKSPDIVRGGRPFEVAYLRGSQVRKFQDKRRSWEIKTVHKLCLQVICTLGYHHEVLPTSELNSGSSSAHSTRVGEVFCVFDQRTQKLVKFLFFCFQTIFFFSHLFSENGEKSIWTSFHVGKH